jgi:hypothetical protein
MDKPAKFYDNMPATPASGMTPQDYHIRNLEFSRAVENADRNDSFTPTLKETFFGNAATFHGSKAFSIQTQRAKERTLGAERAREIGKRRKLASASERPNLLVRY